MAHPVKRCLFNLIVYSGVRTEYFHKVVRAIQEKFPCQVIFIENGPKWSFKNLEIQSPPEMLKKVPYVVLPHLIADVPIFLLWGQDPTMETTILPHFLPLANRLVFDAECTDDITSFSERILALLEDIPVEIMDMDWAIISGWRHIIAETLTHFHIQKIRITYNKHKTPAIYLTSWLKAQLDIPFETKLIEGCCQLAPGAIMAIDIETADAHYNYTRGHNPLQITVRISGEKTCKLPITCTLPDISRGLNLLKEIFYFKTSTHYKNMLEVINET